MNILESVCDHLDFLGLGIMNTDEAEGNLFWGILPDSPDRALAVMSTDSAYGGSAAGARIQIFTRGPVGEIRVPYEWAVDVCHALEGFHGFLHGDGPYVRIEPVSIAQGAGADTSGRYLYVSNYRIFYCDY